MDRYRQKALVQGRSAVRRQLDFLIGASSARGGKAFICMSSTYKDKSGQLFSRVLPQFNGDIITSPRSQVYFLATEYGVINMEGRSTWERAEGLLSMPPGFQGRLIKEAEKRRYGGVRIRGSRSQRQGDL